LGTLEIQQFSLRPAKIFQSEWQNRQNLSNFTIMSVKSMPTNVQTGFAERIKAFALEEGFDVCGIVSVDDDPAPPELEYFQEWIAQGRAGEMEYLKSRNEAGELKRAALRNAVPWVRSVVVCAINYNADQPYSTEVSDPERGWVSRYAWFKPSASASGAEDSASGKKQTADYHDAVLRRLRLVESKLIKDWDSKSDGSPLQTRGYVDTGPIVERVYAKYAGIGWMGKNTCIINEKLGSWLFLGVILTSLDATQLGESHGVNGSTKSSPFDLPAADRCGSCTRCLDACPTGALTPPYQMDATRCIAYLTIEKRGEIAEELRGKMGHHIFGCDICQDVCPWNVTYSRSADGPDQRAAHRAPAARAVEFQARPDLVHPALERFAQMTREEFNEAFRHSPVKRAKYEGIRRNVTIAMGNSGNARFIPVLERLVQDADANVAEHAKWALKRLKTSCQ